MGAFTCLDHPGLFLGLSILPKNSGDDSKGPIGRCIETCTFHVRRRKMLKARSCGSTRRRRGGEALIAIHEGSLASEAASVPGRLIIDCKCNYCIYNNQGLRASGFPILPVGLPCRSMLMARKARGPSAARASGSPALQAAPGAPAREQCDAVRSGARSSATGRDRSRHRRDRTAAHDQRPDGQLACEEHLPQAARARWRTSRQLRSPSKAFFEPSAAVAKAFTT